MTGEGRALIVQSDVGQSMVDVAQLVERRVVAPVVVGSIPIVHPTIQGVAQLVNQVDNLISISKLRGSHDSGR
jgi:hypothetical protein